MRLTNSSTVALPVSKVVASSPMTIVAFDSAVAAEHGFRIVTMPDGRQATVADAAVSDS
jgi:hypothetical protein